MVLLALCDNANDEGECYPSVQTLAAKCSVSDRAVQMQLTKLEEMGYVAREIRTGRSTVYHIRKPSEWPSTPERRSPPKDVHPRTTFTPPPNDIHPTPEPRSPHPRTSFTHNHHLTVSESSKKQSLSGKPDLMPQVREVLQFLRNMTGRNYREAPPTVILIKARLKTTSIEDIKRTLAYKGNQWLDDPVMEKYLRPATLFGATKFEQYLAEALADEQN